MDCMDCMWVLGLSNWQLVLLVKLRLAVWPNIVDDQLKTVAVWFRDVCEGQVDMLE